MKKKEMAIAIASALLNCKVDENNWKVKDLMKRSKTELESHIYFIIRLDRYLADKILTGDVNQGTDNFAYQQ